MGEKIKKQILYKIRSIRGPRLKKTFFFVNDVYGQNWGRAGEGEVVQTQMKKKIFYLMLIHVPYKLRWYFYF
jgi:hypothetical protein